jgi:hypothetical protein
VHSCSIEIRPPSPYTNLHLHLEELSIQHPKLWIPLAMTVYLMFSQEIPGKVHTSWSLPFVVHVRVTIIQFGYIKLQRLPK